MTKQGLYEFVIVYRPRSLMPSVVTGSVQHGLPMIFADSPGDACKQAKMFIPTDFLDKVQDLEILVRPF
jgi:hypothetical protein